MSDELPPTPSTPSGEPERTPEVFAVSRRFDMATILVAMVCYALMFGGLSFIPWMPAAVMGVLGLFVAVVAVTQAVTIRWNKPRAASVIAGAVYWWLFAAAMVLTFGGGLNPCAFMSLLFIATLMGPMLGYIAGALVGGVFLVSHYLRESNLLRRRHVSVLSETDSPFDSTLASAEDERD